MTQASDETSVGYALKRTQARLHAVMEEHLAPLGLGVSQYACLTLLDHQPGISNADLARGVFVSRQATHQLLTGLRTAGLIETDGTGRAQRFSLSRHGAAVLRDAAARVAEVEHAMLLDLTPDEQDALKRALHGCADALDRARAEGRLAP